MEQTKLLPNTFPLHELEICTSGYRRVGVYKRNERGDLRGCDLLDRNGKEG